jgi:hypothetical protein
MQTTRREDGGREAAHLLRREDEVDHGANHRGEGPRDADGAHPGTRHEIEHKHEAGGAQERTEDGQPAGALSVATQAN